ncbi:hypothetical protein WJX74_006812 [Apatococcus lobatus]|uniref:Uncharacterized protein n=1 Tax=Apatococcus lobatus TaxID=904363 RepID=A0AAW1RCY6_9CHLO
MPALADNSNKELSFETYAELKERVQQLKSSQSQSKQLQQGLQQLEVLAAEKAEGEQREQLLQSRIQALSDSLKQAYDRASRGRVHHERDKKMLARKVEELAQQLKAAEASHKAAVQALQADHQRHVASLAGIHRQELTALQNQLQQAAESQAEDVKAAQTSIAATEQRAAEWCRQELDSVAAEFGCQLEGSRAKTASQQNRAERAEASLDNARDLIGSLQAQLQQVQDKAATERAEHERCKHQLGESQQQAAMLKSQAQQGSQQAHSHLHVALQQHQAEMAHQVKLHQEEVEVLHGRVAGILGRKDEQISQLTKQAAQLQHKLLSYDELFAKEKQSLLNVCGE